MADVGVLVKGASKFAITHFETILPAFGVSVVYFIIPLIFAFASCLLTVTLFKYYRNYLPDNINEENNKITYDNIFITYEILIFIFLFSIFGEVVDGIFIPLLITIVFIFVINHYFNHIQFSNISFANIKNSIGLILVSTDINRDNRKKLIYNYILKLSFYSLILVSLFLFLFFTTDISELSINILFTSLQLLLSYIICRNSGRI